ncbi:putative AAA ATPase [Skeletonema marinoi]|uniref:AAA ATPase n=1 Tax=Skeletonema marinoi TaxID=267567 RepID=A0AAD8Y623_9STRA|nr:putative AAA ATPase [Skeletonema marinoi]
MSLSSSASSLNHRSSSMPSLMGDTSSSTRHLAQIVVTAAESSQHVNKQISNIAQLRISNMQLHGRDDDIKLLRSKLRELAKKDDGDEEDAAKNRHVGEMILVSGTSGTGKSALIQKGLGDPAANRGYIFASGKFEDKLLRPLSAFSDAMTCLAKCITVEHNKKGGLLSSSGGSSIAALVRDKIQNEFDETDAEQLRRVLPGCAELLGARRSSLFCSPSQSQADSAALFRSGSGSRLGSLNLLGGKESVSQMQYAVRRLLKIVCSHFKGVVLFIDDLQWSDTATLDLLKSIVLDGEIPSLMIVGAYREDEVPDHHPLAFHIRELQEMKVSITKIKIGNLSVDYAIPLVAEALGMDDDDSKVKSLAETIHRKTDGNPFFILMFLRSLYDEKLLQFNFGVMKWTWDEDAVNSKIVTENVATVLVNKMNRLQEETQRMLMVASCLGATFRLSAVMTVMKNISRVEMRASMGALMRSVSGTAATMGNSSASLLSSDLSNACTDHDGSDSSYASSVEEFEGEGLCEVDNEECRFMHDQIQSAAFELISPEQRDSFRGRIGSVLLRSLSTEELEASLFEVVGLLNCAASNSNVTDEERHELARMNLKAGIKASENAAFDTAKVYFKTGCDALGSRGWEGDNRTMLDLCSHGANACFVTGDFDSMNALIDEVLSKDIDTKEKFRVSEIKVKSLHNIGKFNESIDAALDFRRQLEFIRVKKLLKNKSAEDIANLPELDDERYEMGGRMNEYLATCIYRVEPTMLPLIIFQSVTTSLKHGLSSSSPSGFAGLGMLLCGPFGKPHEGREMAKAAELILQKPGMRSRAVYTVFITQTFCYHWTSPLQDTIEPLLECYQIGLEIGDTDSACYCLLTRSYFRFFVGRALDSIQKELEASISVLTQLKQDENLLHCIGLLTTVKKLRGIDAEAGDKILDSMLATAALADDFTLSATVNVMKLEVFVFYQKWKEAVDLVRKAGNVRQFLTASFASVRYTFLEALTYLKAAQSASGWKKRQMKKCAYKTLHLIRGWAKNGNVNVVHYLYILDAELAVLNGKNKKAKERFNAAITISSRNGFLHDRALAHELASAYFRAQGDDYWGNYHIECSRACNQEWGFIANVEQL